MRDYGKREGRYHETRVLALTLVAISSTAQAKITELMCTADNGRQWAVSTDDERGRATITYLGDGTVNADQRVAFTPDDVRIALGDDYLLRDRSHDAPIQGRDQW